MGIAFSVQMFTVCITALAIALFCWLVPISAIDYPLLLVAMLSLLGAPAQTVLLSSMRGQEQHRRYAWFNAAGVVLSSGTPMLSAVT